MSAPDPIEPLASPATRIPRQEALGVLMYLLAAFMFALNGTVAKAQIEAGLTPGHVTEIRTAGSAIVVLLVILVSRPSSLRVTRAEIPFLVVFGVVSYALTPFLFFATIALLPIAIGTLFAFLAPVWVALWLRFARHRPVRRSLWLAIGLVLVGLALVAQVWAGVTLNPLGLLFGLLVGISLAVYLLLGEEGAKRRDILSLAFWGFFIATVTWSIISPWWVFPWSTLTTTTTLFDGAVTGIPVWSLVIWMIALTVVPFLLVLGSLQRIGAQRGGIIGTTEPLWAAVVGFIVLGETITPVQGLGGLVVLSGVILAEISSQRTARAGAPTR